MSESFQAMPIKFAVKIVRLKVYYEQLSKGQLHAGLCQCDDF